MGNSSSNNFNDNYDVLASELAKHLKRNEQGADVYFRELLQGMGASECCPVGNYPTFKDLNVIRAAQSASIKRTLQ